MTSQLYITPENARTFDIIMQAVRRRYFSEHPTPLKTIVFEDADYIRLGSERVLHSEHSLLAAVCSAVLQQFDIRNVYALSSYMRSYNSALAHINRTRVAVQRPLDPAAADWTDDDVFAEARRLGWS